MSLREDLAVLLANNHDAPIVDSDGFVESVTNSPGRNMNRWLRLAAEVLRQMEWARSHCLDGVTRLEESASGKIEAVKFSNPLTLARDDWKP